jgi:hypothetical protein
MTFSLRMAVYFAMMMSNPVVCSSQELDGNGFYGIAWGTALTDMEELVLIESSDTVQTYILKNRPPRLGNVTVESLRFVAIDGQFARLSVRYSGGENHNRIVAYFESRLGRIDRIPGSMMRGLNQQYTWRDQNTEVNLSYRSYQDRGTVFIESRTLAPRFNDVLPNDAF